VDAAIATLTRIIALVPNSVRAFVERAQAYIRKNDLMSALADLNRALTIDANNVQALFTRGLLQSDLRIVPNAMADCEKVMKLAPADARGNYCRGVVLAGVRNWAPAIQDLTKVIDGNSSMARLLAINAYSVRGKCYLETDAFEAASGDADKALTLNPHFAPALALKGSVLLAKGEVDRALVEFERALKIQSNNLDAIIGHSSALIVKGLQQHRSTKVSKE
jgi:tetratricopeptide (TPR) repeat protein